MKNKNIFGTLKNIAKVLNTIANILLIPFTILFGTIGILVNAGIKESKKDK